MDLHRSASHSVPSSGDVSHPSPAVFSLSSHHDDDDGYSYPPVSAKSMSTAVPSASMDKKITSQSYLSNPMEQSIISSG